MQQHDPTMFATSEELRIGNIRLKAFDIGGHVAARKSWKNYFPNIYLVDAANRQRLAESKYEFEQVIENPMLANIPIAVLGNKIDKRLALSLGDFSDEMGLEIGNDGKQLEFELVNEKPVKIFMCSLSKRQGYLEAFQWLGQFLK